MTLEIEKYKEKLKDIQSQLKILQETNKSLYIEINRYKEKLIESETQYREYMEKYNDIKQRNVELKKLYDIKSRMNKNTSRTIVELSSQINIKNRLVKEEKKKVDDAKMCVIEYRELNKTLQNKLKDKDIYIEKLINSSAQEL
jgi:septal ring factor EnvC (AmiA/AmiB activator)